MVHYNTYGKPPSSVDKINWYLSYDWIFSYLLSEIDQQSLSDRFYINLWRYVRDDDDDANLNLQICLHADYPTSLND